MSQDCHSIIYYLFSTQKTFLEWAEHEYNADKDSSILMQTIQLLLGYLFFSQFLLNYFTSRNNGKCFWVFVRIDVPFAPLYELFDWNFNSRGMYPPGLGCLPCEISWWLISYYTQSVYDWPENLTLFCTTWKQKGKKTIPQSPQIAISKRSKCNFNLQLSLISSVQLWSSGWL